MTDPRIVSPQEAHRAIDETATYKVDVTWRELAHTVATEPDRTRAAVVKALRDGARNGYEWAKDRAAAIENGADY